MGLPTPGPEALVPQKSKCIRGGIDLWEPRGTNDVFRVLLVLLADVFHQFFVRPQTRRKPHSERLRVGSRIVDCGLVHERSEVSVCGCPRKSNQNLSLNPTVSMTSVSPSHRPTECPYQVGSGSSGCLRPSMKIWR
jgi:hypothetical protein